MRQHPIQRGFNRRSAQRGVSLIELMIAIALTAFLILGLVQIFGASRLAYQGTVGISRAQEGGRFAIDFLQRDLRMAGHMGCEGDRVRIGIGLDSANAAPLVDNFFLSDAERLDRNHAAAAFPLRFDIPIQGFEAVGTGSGGVVDVSAPSGGWVPALDPALAGLSPAPRPGSDILVLRLFSGDGAQLAVPIDAASGSVGLPLLMRIEPARAALISAGGYYGITSCDAAAVFQASTGADAGAGFLISNTAGVGITNSNRASGFSLVSHLDEGPKLFNANQAKLFRLDSLVYYVALGAGGVPSLFRARFQNGRFGVSEELVEGVDSLQLRYGRDRLPAGRPDGTVDDYVSAELIEAATVGYDARADRWREVVSVEVGMVLRSPERAGLPGRNIGAHGGLFISGVRVDSDPADGILRSPYETTVTLRNRLFGN